MEENANANVQGAQENPQSANPADPAPAANGETQTTDPNAGGLTFDPEIQKFLDNQNVDTSDPKAAIELLARRNMKLRGHQQSKEEPKEDKGSKEIADVLNGGASQPSQTIEKPAPKDTTQPNLSELEIATVSMVVQSQYPDVKADANFYRSMINDGFMPIKNGSLNLRSVLDYAKYKQTLATAEATIKNAGPSAENIPSPSNQQEYAEVDEVGTMTKTAAENIVIFSNREKRAGRPVHPQLDEAINFLQRK